MNKYDLLELYELALDKNFEMIISTLESIWEEKAYKNQPTTLKEWHEKLRRYEVDCGRFTGKVQFNTLDAARGFCENVRKKTGEVLSIS